MKKSSIRWLVAGTAIHALASVTGCGHDTQGALEQTALTPECADDDISCQSLGLDAPLSVGGSVALDINMTTPGNSTPLFTLQSAVPQIIATDGDRLTAHAPGVTAIVLVADNDLIADFVHVWAERPSHIVFERGGEELRDRLELLVNDEVRLRVSAYKDNVALLGEATTDWSSSNDSVVSILSDGSPNARRLVARSLGTTTISATAFGLTTTYDIEVVE